MVKQLLDTLRQKLADSPDFSKTMYFFMDNIASLPAFLEEGKLSGPDPMIKAILEAALKAALKTKGFKFRYTEDVRLEAYQFSHGPFLVSGTMDLYFFFHDTGQGLAMFQADGGGTSCVRISCMEVPTGNWTDLSTQDKAVN